MKNSDCTLTDREILDKLGFIPRGCQAAREFYYKLWFSPNRPKEVIFGKNGGSFYIPDYSKLSLRLAEQNRAIWNDKNS